MPKINLPELQALAEYLTGKVPRLGMFSTLKGLIDNSPKHEATAQEWAGYFKPGQIATRAGVEFPLKKEELDYSGIPDLLAGRKPGDKISRDEILATYLKNAPDLNLHLGSLDADAGNTPEALAAARQGILLGDRLTTEEDRYSQYSHADRAAPANSSNPFGSRSYQLSITKGTPEQIGEFPDSHFTPQDISWSRTNRLPMDPFSHGVKSIGVNPDAYQGRTMRVIDEIQSDRHQRAIRKDWHDLPPDAQARGSELVQNLSTAHDPQLVHQVFNNRIEPSRMTDDDVQSILNDPDYQELGRIRKLSHRAQGYQDKGVQAQLEALRAEADRMGEIPQKLLLNSQGSGLYFDEDPDLARQRMNLDAKIADLSRGIPDTPFKTTQGYVGLEMRKALNDALQSGDSALSLASGNDQAAFYGHRFNDDQTTGQNYNYNTSYPSVLKDLARRYGLPYGPQAAHFERDVPYQEMWPPSRMKANMMQHEGYEEPTLENFLRYTRDPDIIDPTDEPGTLKRMYSSLLAPLDEREDISFNHSSDDVAAAIKNMQNTQAKMNAIQYEIPDYLPPQPGHPKYEEYQEHLKDKEAQRAVVHGALGEVFDQYKSLYDPSVRSQEADTVPKTFENAIDLGDANAVTKAKAAGVPVWHSGGSVDEFDHVGHAMHRLGFIKPTQEKSTEMADGGSVDDSPSDLPSRAGYAVMKHFYGPDSEGHEVLLPGSSTLGLKELESIPYRLSQLGDMIAGTPPVSAAPKGLTPEQAAQWAGQKVAESAPLAGSRQAATDAETTENQLRKESGITLPHTFTQHLAENADAVVPVPGLKAEGTLSHLLAYLGGASPKNYPRMLAEWAGLNSALENLSERIERKPQPVEAKADGGQPGAAQPFDADAQDTSQVQNQELNDMMTRRMFTHPMASMPIAMPPMPQMAGGGEVGVIERLAQLLQRMKDPTELSQTLGEHPVQREELPSEEELQAVFQRLRQHLGMPPAQAAPGEELTQPETTGLAAGGDIRRRPAILENPLTAGKPPGIVPAFERPQQAPRPSQTNNFQQTDDMGGVLEALRARLLSHAQ